jgi:hypothetical protein
MKEKNILSSAWAWFCNKAFAVANPIVESLVYTKPLPAWTNKELTCFCVAVWVFAISLNWFADSKTFIVLALSAFLVKFVTIFAE